MPNETLIDLLGQIEMHCPCGARPESLNTHPHVSGCPVERSIIAARQLELSRDEWRKLAEDMTKKLFHSMLCEYPYKECGCNSRLLLTRFRELQKKEGE